MDYMVVIAQLVRASVCGTEGRGFEPHSPPLKKESDLSGSFFCYVASVKMPARTYNGVTYLTVQIFQYLYPLFLFLTRYEKTYT